MAKKKKKNRKKSSTKASKQSGIIKNSADIAETVVAETIDTIDNIPEAIEQIADTSNEDISNNNVIDEIHSDKIENIINDEENSEKDNKEDDANNDANNDSSIDTPTEEGNNANNNSLEDIAEGYIEQDTECNLEEDTTEEDTTEEDTTKEDTTKEVIEETVADNSKLQEENKPEVKKIRTRFESLTLFFNNMIGIIASMSVFSYLAVDYGLNFIENKVPVNVVNLSVIFAAAICYLILFSMSWSNKKTHKNLKNVSLIIFMFQMIAFIILMSYGKLFIVFTLINLFVSYRLYFKVEK